MNTFTVSFFGHRYINNPFPIEKELEQLISMLLHREEYVEFLVGRNGEFDQIVSSTICRCKREIRDNNSSHVWVLPYMTADYREYEEDYRAYYDEIEICEESAVKHFKSSIQVRNRQMVDRSDLVVCYVETNKGGAYQAMQYALRQEKDCFNIYNSLQH